MIRSVILDSVPETELGSLIVCIIKGWVSKNSVSTALDLLPFCICDLQNFEHSRVLPVAAAWVLLRLAAKSFDDVEDGDAKDNIGEATNLASGLLVAAYQVLTILCNQNNLSFQDFQRIIKEFNISILRACQGQHLELTSRREFLQICPDEWLKIASGKSGDLFGWVTWASAFLITENPRIIEKYHEFGFHLGILLQVVDDFNDFYDINGTDLFRGEMTLPVSYALYVANNNERKILVELLKDASQGNEEAIKKARQSITRLGAIEYMISAAWVQRQKALDAICAISSNFPLDESHPLVSLLNHIVANITSRNDQTCLFKN